MKATLELDLNLSIQVIESNGDIYKMTVEKYNKEKCICGCGKPKDMKSKYFSPACKTRVYRRNLKK